ncbi:MAG: ABC transporter substrate-binding protein [Candidatus Xenobia bacterium]
MRLAGTALVLALLLAGCVHRAPQAHLDRHQVLIIAHAADAVKLDPADESDAESPLVSSNIYDGLVEYQDGSTEVQPALATSWEVSSDQKQWTFHLRPQVKFQDGTPFNADAVVFNFARQMDKQNPYHQYGDFSYWPTMFGGTPGSVKSVQAVDPLTVRFTLNRPCAPFLADMAMASFAIASPAAIQKWKGEFSRHPCGTGPYQFVSWEPNQRIVLQAFPESWHGAPPIRQVVFLPIADAASRRMQLERGEVDVVKGVQLDDLPLLRRNPDIVVAEDRGLNIGFLCFNCERKPFDDVRVRQALNYAIDRATIVKVLYNGCALEAVNPWPPSIWGYDTHIQPYPYDPQHARQLLAQAGYARGFSTELLLPSADRDYLPDHENIAEAIQEDLAAVGVQARIVMTDFSTYLDRTANGDFDTAFIGWVGDNGDPDNFIYSMLDETNAVKGGTNSAFYKNHDLHRILLQAQQTVEKAKRIALYQTAQEIVHRDCPWVPIAYGDQVVAWRRGLQGLQLHPTGILRLREVHW